MGFDSDQFGFEQFDARAKLVLRIAVEALAGELAGGTVPLLGRIAPEERLVVHCNATLDALRFLSTVCITAPRKCGARRPAGRNEQA